MPQAISVGDVIKPDAIGVLRNGIADVYNAFSAYAVTLTWTDPTITPGLTPVRAAHLQEIRDAMH